MKYRPEIDGLRTIAVLAVMIYHAEFSLGSAHLLQGGFFGVDVFFVISGFLITSLIRGEYSRTGGFSLINFYERRARRLLPALLTVMLVSLPVAWVTLFPEQLIDFSKSLIASLAFGSNFYWHDVLQAYEAESALLRPFLHTWSLAVEEQFYIFFPLGILAIYRWFPKWMMHLLVVGFCSSLAFAEWMTSRDVSFSFYMLPSRFWELSVGSLLAFILPKYPANSFPRWTRFLPGLGILMILLSVAFINFESNHPGVVTLVPVMGTALVIWFGGVKGFVGQVLSSRLFVSIGLISYSLYLWHYPIFAFGRIRKPEVSDLDRYEWIVLTFILSIASYLLVERPARSREKLSRNYFLVAVLSGLVVVTGYSVYSVRSGGVDGRFSDFVRLYGKNKFDNRTLKIESWKLVEKQRGKTFSERENTVKVLVLGDSHSKDFYNALVQNADLFTQAEFRQRSLTLDGSYEKIFALPKFKDADVILFSARYDSQELRNLSDFISLVKQHGKKVIITSSTVEFRPKRKIHIFDWYIRTVVPRKGFSANRLKKLFYRRRRVNIIGVINRKVKVVADAHHVPYIEKSLFMCDSTEKTCDGVTPDGYKALFDSTHWTLEGAKHFGKRIHELNLLRLAEIF